MNLDEREVIPISELFHRLDKDRQEQVLQAAMLVFSRHGYRKTSTQQVAEAAGISKGMVFHYFGSKQALFELLCQQATDYFQLWSDAMKQEIQGMDYIARFSWLSRHKLESYLKNPEIFAFSSMLLMQPEHCSVSPQVQDSCQRLQQLQQTAFLELAHSGNTQHFREDLPPEDIQRYITHILEGYSQEVMASLKGQSLDQLQDSPSWAAFDQLLSHLRLLFYKPEEGK